MILLNTGCRPEAAWDLTVFQVRQGGSRLDLNPPGREQTHKFRPVVPVTATLRPWLEVTGRERLVGRGEKWLGDAWRATRGRAGLDAEVIPYTLRHALATELDEAGVDENEIGALMGWQPANRMRLPYTKRTHPDTELLRLGRDLDTAWARERAIFATARAAGCYLDDDEADAALDRCSDLAERIRRLPALTLDGLRVKARAYAWATNDEAPDPEAEETTDRRVMRSILRDLLAAEGRHA